MKTTQLPLEIERKYLIRYPDLALLSQIQGYNRSSITQTYLKSENPAFGLRIRKRGTNGIYTYTKTFKRNITSVSRIEIEDEITKEEYTSLLKRADPSLRTIKKERHCFRFAKKLFELDTYPFWDDRATLEIELTKENEPFTLPPFISVIKEVTTDSRYKNRSLARIIPHEEI